MEKNITTEKALNILQRIWVWCRSGFRSTNLSDNQKLK